MKRYKVVLGYRDENGDLAYKVSSVRGEVFELDDRLFVHYRKKNARLVDIKSGYMIMERDTLDQVMRDWIAIYRVKYNQYIQTPRYKEVCRTLEVK